jgi:hypothetical protein
VSEAEIKELIELIYAKEIHNGFDEVIYDIFCDKANDVNKTIETQVKFLLLSGYTKEEILKL